MYQVGTGAPMKNALGFHGSKYIGEIVHNVYDVVQSTSTVNVSTVRPRRLLLHKDACGGRIAVETHLRLLLVPHNGDYKGTEHVRL
jgi:hypothetical protein